MSLMTDMLRQSIANSGVSVRVGDSRNLEPSKDEGTRSDDDNAWKYISVGDFSGLSDYTDREYDYRKIPFLGQFVGHAADAATDGIASLAQFAGFEKAGDFLHNEAQKGEAQLPSYTKPSLSLDYITDPNGLTSAAGMVTGSMLSIAPVAALIPESAVAGAVTAASKVPKIGGPLSRFVGNAIRWAPTGPVEAAMEGGAVEREMLENGASREDANRAAWDVFKGNAALLTATNAVEGGLLGKLVHKAPTFSNPIANTFSKIFNYVPQTAAEMAVQGYEEGAQEGISRAAMGQGEDSFSQVLNPVDWTDEQWDAAKMGAAGSFPLVGGTAMMRHLQGALSSADDTEDAPTANNAPTLTSGNAEIDDAIVSAAAKHGLPADLLFAVAQAESDFDQSSVSSTGAKGIMQLMPDTAAALGVDADDMVQNIEGGARYLKQQLDDFGGNVEMALAAYNAGPGAVEKYKGVPPYTETQNYVAKIMGILDGANMNPATEAEPTHSLLDDAEPFIGTRMVNGARGCVEAVTKIGAAGSDFLRAELEAGVVNVDRLVKDAGDRVIPFDPSKLEEGDVIVYGDDTDSQQHVVLYDGKGGYIGNSSDLKLVVHRNDYNAMGSLYPTKIIKSGGRYGGTVNISSVSGSVRPIDYSGLVVDAKNLQANAAAMKALIEGDKLTPAQKAAIIDAAEIIRDTPTEASTASPGEDALDYNAWQRLIDHKDIKGIFAKDPERVTRMVMRGEETQRKAQTVAAIENQQKVAQAQSVQAQVQAAAQAQPVANPAESAARLASVQQELSMPPMAQQEIAARLASYAQTTPHDVERVVIQNGLAHGDFSGIARALPAVYRAAAGRWMQQPQEQAQAQPQAQPQPQTQPPAMPTQQDMQVPDVAVPPSQEMTAQMPQQMQGQAQAVPTTEDLADIRQKLAALDAMMQGNPTYVEARRRGDWQTAAQEAAKAGHHDFARFYQMLHEKATGAPINITPYQNPTEKAAAEQSAVRPTPAPVPINHVDSMRPIDIPKSYGARRDFGRGLIKAMRMRNLPDVRALNDDLRNGEKRAIEHALKRIAQVDAEDALLRGETAAQRANDNETVQAESRKKQGDDVQVESAQKQSKEKTANEGGLELADGYTTESGRPLSEADEKEFIIKPNGSRNFGEITKTISDAVMQQSGESLPIGEIRLRVGNEIEGLIHAKAHTAEAKQAGYSSVEELIADVAQNFNQIYMRAPDNANGKPTYSLVKTGNKKAGIMNGVAPVYFELQSDDIGNYYIVVTAMPKGDSQLARQTKKDRLIYSSPGLGAATVSGDGAVSHDGSAGAVHRGGSPTSDKSSGLVTSTIPSDVSESKQKRVSNANGEGNGSTNKSNKNEPSVSAGPVSSREALGTPPVDGSSVSNIPSEQEKSKEKSVQAKSAPLTKQEQEALTGTSEEAKEAYRIVRDKLAKSKNKSVVRAAKVGATLFARHADIYAKAYSKATGKPYTALDYLQDKFGLDADGKEIDGSANGFGQRKTPLSDTERKKMQLHIIQDTNPMNDDIHTGVRSTKDILSAKEAFETKVDENSFAYPDFTEADGRTALRRGYVEIYSSHPIVPGAFVTPSQMQAKDYAGSGRVYSKRVPLRDVAWLHSDEGQYAPVEQESFDQSAWHGTPHKFKKFDLGAIGTGEGAQVHGWGLYFAQQKSVGKGYREGLTGGKWRVSHGDEVYEFDYDTGDLIHEGTGSVMSHDDPETLAIEAFIGSNADKYGALNILENALEDKRRMFFPGEALDEEVGRIEDAIELLENEWSRFDVEPSGSLFQVEIPDNDVLLDEQKPLEEQPKIVKLLDKYAEKIDDWSFTLGEAWDGMTGKEFYEYISDVLHGDKAASEYLNEAGIKGITYEGQRDGRCFVIFDDEAIEIIEEFNQRMNSIRKGSITPQASGRRIISLFEQADESTFLHEMGHMFLMDLEDLAAIDAASAEDLETVRDWATWQEGQAKEYEDTPWQKEFSEREKALLAAKKRGDVVEVRKLRREWEQERFARGFERYLETGKAPTSVLKRIFQKFKKFLQSIYQAFKGTGGKASPEVEAVMGRMIAEEQGDKAEESKRNPVPTLDTLFQEAPALKKVALEYGATEKDGEVTFENPEREKEFVRIAEALQSDVAKKLSAAWTGSSADFDNFDMAYVGTGVGAQAHGYGLHMAEERKTAEGYRSERGKLYHVEIPDNDVLLDEQKSFDEQPLKVRKALEKIVHSFTLEQLENWNDVRRLGKARVVAEIMDALSESNGMNIYGTISDLVEGQKEASTLLNQYGIKGITYHETQSGRCYVIFDDKAIKILEKFSARRREALSKVLKEVELIAPEKLTKRQQGIVDFGKEMGMPVVFFKGAKNLHGFHASNGVTFLNTESETSLRWTFWHEALHWMKANNEELFREIIADVEKAGAFTKAQLDGYRKAIGAPELSDADVIEEMLADALPDVKRRVPFLKDLGKRNKSLAERFVGWIREVMDRFRDFFHTPEMGLTTAQSTAMRNAFASLARDMVDERGRRIFRVDEFSRRITLANGSPLPSAKYSLDNGGRQAEEASILMQLYNKGHYSELVRMDEENRHLPHGSTRKQANVVQADLLKKYRNLDITNKSTGEIARITKDGAGKMVSDKAIAKSIANGFSGDEHLQAVSEIKALFENGELIRVAPDKKGSADIQAIKHFWIRRQDGSYANILVKQYTDARIPQKIYTLELQELKKPSDLKDVSDEHPSEGVEPDATALGFGAPRGNGSISNFSITQKGEEGNRNLYEKPRLAPNGKPSNLTKEQYEAVRTPAFKAWFGDWEHDAANASKVVDENGEPLVVYHGTPLGGFNTFKRQQNYFTSMKWYADRYQDESTSSNFVPDKHENPAQKMTYAVFLNIKKPFDTRNKRERTIFEKEFYRQWGYGASLSDKGLPDWTDGDDLQEFFEEKGYDYDGLLLDEGGIPDNNGGVISRGISYVTFEPNQIKSATDNIGAYNTKEDDIRFSVKFSRDSSKPGSMGRFRKLLVGLKIGEAAESNLEVHRSNKETQLVISASKLNQFMADKSLTEKNILKTEDLGGGKIRVTYMPQDFHNIHILDWVKSVRQLRKKNPFVKAIYDLGSRAMRLQEHLRNEGAKTVKEFHNLTKDKNDRKLVSSILLEGDAAGKEYGVQELRAMGANANVIKAYQLVRRTMREWYKRVNDARMQVETRTKTLSKNDLADFKKNHWIADSDVLSVEEKGDGKVLLTWRGGKTYETKDKVMTKTELDALLQDKDINVAHVHKLNDSYGVDNYSVDYVERIKPLGNLTGYMPHFFHEWMVYEKHKDPKTGEVRLTTIGSGRSMNDAVRLGNEIARKNSDKEYVVQPKGFDLNVENSVVIGDVDFQQMAAKLAENTTMTLSDANAFLRNNAGATMRARHRFFGNAMHRTGAKGFDTDITYVLTHYLNTSARYIAMEQFKPRAVTLYERWFGAFDADPKDATASYVKGLIKDINGDPRPLEKSVSELIMKTPIGKMISDAYGDRAALSVNSELSTWNAISKLGLGNFASMAVNFSQFINIGAAMNDYGYAAKGFRSALHPTAADVKILEESGVLDEINQAADNGGYTQRRFGRVGSVYGAIKRGGELSLLPFQYADVLMRKTAILGAYKQGVEKLGLSHEEAMERARDINYDANFDYSAANAPLMIRAGSVVTQQMFQFQKYPIMQMEFMYNILKNGTRGQKVRFLLPYVLMCGIPGTIPFGAIFNQIFSFLFHLATGGDKDIGDEIKAEALRWAGKDPVKKAIVNASIYGVLAPVFGIDVSKRIGISGAFSGEFFGAQKPESVLDVLGMQLGGPMASTAVNMANQIHNGNPIEALKAFSPALGNMAQAMVGVSRTTRHRVKSRYEVTYDRIIHALGFRSVDESNNSFITSYEFDRKDAETHAKQEAIMDYLDDPSEANRQRINALGIKDKAIEEARIQQERSATERAKGGRPKVESGKTSKRRTSHKRKEEKPKKETLFDTIGEEDEGM